MNTVDGCEQCSILFRCKFCCFQINGDLAVTLSRLRRDLKPENIVFCEPFQAWSKAPETARLKIIDFGLATYYDADIISSGIIGSPGYAAPEVRLRSHQCWNCTRCEGHQFFRDPPYVCPLSCTPVSDAIAAA